MFDGESEGDVFSGVYRDSFESVCNEYEWDRRPGH